MISWTGLTGNLWFTKPGLVDQKVPFENECTRYRCEIHIVNRIMKFS